MPPPAVPVVKRGFACADNAAKAARKNHDLGTAHKWTSETAKQASLQRKRAGRRAIAEH